MLNPLVPCRGRQRACKQATHVFLDDIQAVRMPLKVGIAFGGSRLCKWAYFDGPVRLGEREFWEGCNFTWAMAFRCNAFIHHQPNRKSEADTY
jgi:hypothetical protein